MIRIELNQNWINFGKLYGANDIRLRYQWFLFEFGKKATNLFYKHLVQQIKDIPGTEVYKKSLMVAEIRERGAHKAWWAIVSSAKPLGNAKYDPKTSVFKVVSRFDNVENDPVRVILDELGPWTVDTIPFVPSPRAGQIVMTQESEEKVKAIQEQNFRQGQTTKSAMITHGIPFEPRHTVYQKLRVIEDIELQALRIEFGLAEKSKAHWRPSLRWIKRQGIEALEKDRDLIRMWFDPQFIKYRQFRHFRAKLTSLEVQKIDEFQKKVRV
jgi:hypothetical protein